MLLSFGNLPSYLPVEKHELAIYLSAVDELLRRQDDGPSTGLILCKDKGRSPLNMPCVTLISTHLNYRTLFNRRCRRSKIWLTLSINLKKIMTWNERRWASVPRCLTGPNHRLQRSRYPVMLPRFSAGRGLRIPKKSEKSIDDT